MNYQDTIKYLYSSTPVFERVGASAYKPGLGNSIALDEHLGKPSTRFLSVHIAGTNGKGSCSHTLAAILQADGYKVGLYTSPHLASFRERIRVNGEMIPEDYVVNFVRQNKDFFEPLHPSFFELTTAMAFKYFADQDIDIAVVEVGLGGRLDCTNIITPVLSVITNISFDHTQFLGNTLAKIAREKAGIIKPGVPVVVGEDVPETRPVFESVAQTNESTIVFAQDIPAVLSVSVLPDGKRKYHTRYFGDVVYELGGIYQDKNANTVLTAAMILLNMGVIKDSLSVVTGFGDVIESTGLMGRWQKLGDKPLIICDTGHNVGGWQYLSKQIDATPAKTKRIVFGMVDDKDIDTVMTMLPRNAVYYFTQAEIKRAIPVKDVAEKGAKHGLKGTIYKTVPEAYRAALAEADKDDFVFVGGSSYVVSDLLRNISGH